MIKYYKPELSNGNTMGIIVKAPTKFAAIYNANLWLKQQDNLTKLYFTGTETPWVVDAKEIKEELFGVLVV